MQCKQKKHNNSTKNSPSDLRVVDEEADARPHDGLIVLAASIKSSPSTPILFRTASAWVAGALNTPPCRPAPSAATHLGHHSDAEDTNH